MKIEGTPPSTLSKVLKVSPLVVVLLFSDVCLFID